MIKNIFCIGIFVFVSCRKIDCPLLAETCREEECLIIANNFPDKESGHNFEIVGRSLNTGKDTIYKQENRWFCSFYDKISIGDTIIKRKRELIFSIHKKDTILNFNWECEGKVYK